MDICSLYFFLGCCLAPVLFHLIPGKLPRQIFLSLLNFAFLWTFVPNKHSWAFLAAFIVGTYAILWCIRRRPSGLIAFAGIAVVAAAFLVVKKYSFLEGILPAAIWGHAIGIIGISYMLFKFIHMVVDAWQGQLERYAFCSYANYQLSFFTLVAGPIQRYNDFHQYWELMDRKPDDKLAILLAWNRLLTGMIKMGALAAIALYAHDLAGGDWGPQPSTKLLLRFMVFFYSYAFYIYFNFSGYTDIVIGAARLFGFILPENFNYPFLARNELDFWNRWHMTLTQWIRDYIFMTSYKASAQRFPRLSKYNGYVLLFLSLFLAGVWHGSTANFAIFGFIHGFGAMVVQIYTDFLKWRLGRAGYRNYLENAWIRRLGIVMTFHYFCFSLLFFATDARSAFGIIRTLWDGLLLG